jgi:hypothetical protein
MTTIGKDWIKKRRKKYGPLAPAVAVPIPTITSSIKRGVVVSVSIPSSSKDSVREYPGGSACSTGVEA